MVSISFNFKIQTVTRSTYKGQVCYTVSLLCNYTTILKNKICYVLTVRRFFWGGVVFLPCLLSGQSKFFIFIMIVFNGVITQSKKFHLYRGRQFKNGGENRNALGKNHLSSVSELANCRWFSKVCNRFVFEPGCLFF